MIFEDDMILEDEEREEDGASKNGILNKGVDRCAYDFDFRSRGSQIDG